MSKKLFFILDILYFVITFIVFCWLFSSFNSMAISIADFPILKEKYFLFFKIQDILIISFSVLLTSILDFSFISKILIHLKYNKKVEFIVFIILLVVTIIFGVILYNFKYFVPFV